MSTQHNVIAVARREFVVRVRARTFALGTLLLVLGVVAVAFLPVILRYFDEAHSQPIAVVVQADLASDPVASLSELLNAPAKANETTTSTAPPFDVSRVDDLAAARLATEAGTYRAALLLERGAEGDLEFTLYTNESERGATTQLIQQAAGALAIGDRLERLGIQPEDRGALFAPAQFDLQWADPARVDQPRDSVTLGTNYLLGFGMSVLIFMMIILYGTWVAQSVVEEKSSRVMEVILNAATPFQLLTGKVLGVGAVALSQYLALLICGVVALLIQGPVADLVLGGGSGSAVALPQGLTIPMLAAFVVYGVLGFLLYAVLYAAVGSLVSRQEDVNQAVMPLVLVSTAGYMIAVYGSTGLLDMKSGWMVALTQVPFVSPFMMLSRITAGQGTLLEFGLSVTILVLTILGALWVAARIYAAGVLLYGQRPGPRAIWHLVRYGQ